MKEILLFATTWMHLEVNVKLNKSDRKTEILYDLTYMWTQNNKTELTNAEKRSVVAIGKQGRWGARGWKVWLKAVKRYRSANKS